MVMPDPSLSRPSIGDRVKIALCVEDGHVQMIVHGWVYAKLVDSGRMVKVPIENCEVVPLAF